MAAGLVLSSTGTGAWDAARWLQHARSLGPDAVPVAVSFDAMVTAAAQQPEPQGRLALVNRFFNERLRFTDDLDAWGQVDYWASPLEALSHGRGDCEDFAIGKYFALLAAGTPVSQLRLVYVKATLGGSGQAGSGLVQAHMVLAYYPSSGAEPLVLDNLVSEVMPAARRPDLAPVFSFNGQGLWQGVGGPSAGDAATRLSRWRDVLAKAAKEGF